MDLTIEQLKEMINNGNKIFTGISVEEGDLQNFDLYGCVFEGCTLGINFSNSTLRESKFINSNLKTCNFAGADLSGSTIEGNMLCSTDFYRAKIDKVIFKNNYYHSNKLELRDLERMVKESL
ncbi:pentapeptide repeat-containing protein [Paenibacillus harenae]|uniref:Uncharacterized protein YjbI with pentapeptide repeats n=1 Tax=Paenibacillus harenae TaxID=306543 RepID=A0ABT9TYK1_PAEHA|nr:pentapeptide repeat-containing protein [Paenibacillus harenae]MDQ0112456.1 uncharacterized protein YjbI with pentapeptide repeats [Paenibacillus harenae]